MAVSEGVNNSMWRTSVSSILMLALMFVSVGLGSGPSTVMETLGASTAAAPHRWLAAGGLARCRWARVGGHLASGSVSRTLTGSAGHQCRPAEAVYLAIKRRDANNSDALLLDHEDARRNGPAEVASERESSARAIPTARTRAPDSTGRGPEMAGGEE
jgi:hypothetical protein